MQEIEAFEQRLRQSRTADAMEFLRVVGLAMPESFDSLEMKVSFDDGTGAELVVERRGQEVLEPEIRLAMVLPERTRRMRWAKRIYFWARGLQWPAR